MENTTLDSHIVLMYAKNMCDDNSCNEIVKNKYLQSILNDHFKTIRCYCPVDYK